MEDKDRLAAAEFETIAVEPSGKIVMGPKPGDSTQPDVEDDKVLIQDNAVGQQVRNCVEQVPELGGIFQGVLRVTLVCTGQNGSEN